MGQNQENMMALNRSKGQMYKWVDKTYNPLAGKCPHRCDYCWVNNLKKRNPAIMKKYSGEPQLDLSVLIKKVPQGTHFLCSCNDLFAEIVPYEIIVEILRWAKAQNCTWVIQTKNPMRLERFLGCIPINSIVLTTIETNRENCLANAPSQKDRADSIKRIREYADVVIGLSVGITIEPIMDFDLEPFAEMIIQANPDFINIGADSKGHNLPEPSMEKVQELLKKLMASGIEIRKKTNLERLK